MKYLFKNQKGITLIALIITIIVLIILAGVTIATLTGENGLINRAIYAKFATEIKAIEEKTILKSIEDENKITGEVNKELDIKSKYNSILYIQDSELVYIADKANNQQKEWLEKLKIKPMSEYFSVEFNCNNGDKILKQSIKAGDKLNKIENPQKIINGEEHDFLGWYYLEKTGTEEEPIYVEKEFSLDTIIMRDYSIYAKYKKEAVMRARNTNFAFWQTKYRENITEIYFEKVNIIPSDLPELNWNVKENLKNEEAEDVIAFLEGNEIDGYKLKIISTKTIYANPDSSGYFSLFSNLEKVVFDNFDTSKSVSMSYMFYRDSKVQLLDLKKFDTSSVQNMVRMFSQCSNLTKLDVSNWDTNNVENMANMFYGCKISELNLTSFKTENVKTMERMFNQCGQLTTLNIETSKFSTENVTNMESMFEGCRLLETLNLSGFTTNNVITMKRMFYDCERITDLDLSSFYTPNVEDMSGMFSNCFLLTNLKIENFNTSKVIDMNNMFYYCKSIDRLNLSNFNTQNVIAMNNMFAYCSKLTNLNLESFETSKVEDMENMFRQCNSLTELDLSSFNTAKVENMGEMFRYASKLRTIYVGEYDSTTNKGWTTKELKETQTMFLGCGSLVGQNGTRYNEEYVDNSYAQIDSDTASGYFSKKK